jgi:cupin 2 domain-containing protein
VSALITACVEEITHRLNHAISRKVPCRVIRQEMGRLVAQEVRGSVNQRGQMKTRNIFEAIPDHLEQEIFEQLVNSEHARVERIVSKGHRSPESGWYDQEENEWVLVLKGEAMLSFEDQPSVHLHEGDFINIPSHKKHRVDWTDPGGATIWLAVHY